jgi:hypothetical protein
MEAAVSILPAQERVNAQLPKIGATVLGKLENATGYLYNPEGQWISRKNKIPYFIENQYKSLIDYDAYGLGMDNFISYQIREIKLEGHTWLVLIKKFHSGHYRYPSIQKGWFPYNEASYFVFPKEELTKQLQTETTGPYLIKLNLYLEGTIAMFADANIITDIEKAIAKLLKTQETSKNQLIIEYALYKQKNIAQFQIYTWDDEIKYPGHIRNEYKLPKKDADYLVDEESLYNSEKIMKYCYFESGYASFLSLINIK